VARSGAVEGCGSSSTGRDLGSGRGAVHPGLRRRAPPAMQPMQLRVRGPRMAARPPGCWPPVRATRPGSAAHATRRTEPQRPSGNAPGARAGVVGRGGRRGLAEPVATACCARICGFGSDP
jgi:hypothetical protein